MYISSSTRASFGHLEVHEAEPDPAPAAVDLVADAGHQHERPAAGTRRRAGRSSTRPRRASARPAPTQPATSPSADVDQLALEVVERVRRSRVSEMPIDAEATMTRPTAAAPHTVPIDPRDRAARRRGWPLERAYVTVAPARSCGEAPDGGGELIAAMRCSRGTCRGSRRPATAARCRRAARRRCAARTAPRMSPARSGAQTPASAAASAGASRPISTTCRTLPRNAAPQRREVLVLAVAAGDQHERAGQARHGRERRADVGALRVVDVAHAADVGDPLRAVRQPGERGRAPRAPAPRGSSSASPIASAASALAALCRPCSRIADERQQRLAAAHEHRRRHAARACSRRRAIRRLNDTTRLARRAACRAPAGRRR